MMTHHFSGHSSISVSRVVGNLIYEQVLVLANLVVIVYVDEKLDCLRYCGGTGDE